MQRLLPDTKPGLAVLQQVLCRSMHFDELSVNVPRVCNTDGQADRQMAPQAVHCVGRIQPDVTGMVPVSMEMVVVLPAPLCPRSAVICP